MRIPIKHGPLNTTPPVKVTNGPSLWNHPPNCQFRDDSHVPVAPLLQWLHREVASWHRKTWQNVLIRRSMALKERPKDRGLHRSPFQKWPVNINGLYKWRSVILTTYCTILWEPIQQEICFQVFPSTNYEHTFDLPQLRMPVAFLKV